MFGHSSRHDPGDPMLRRAILAGLALLFVVAGIARSVDTPAEEVGTTQESAPTLALAGSPDIEARLAALEEENARLHTEIAALADGILAGSPVEEPLLRRYPVPEELLLCGERLPLERPDVYSRFEEEWTRYLVNQHWMIKWMRRSRDIFPYVEGQLAANGLPTDLKYVLIVESGLESRAYSSAGAAGWWQFIKATGSRYGLKRDNIVDERRDLGLATDAAIQYFTKLYGEFQSWPLALSAYNAGEKRVRDELKSQGESDFYGLSLPRETEAYWFKAAAIKELVENPAKYGIELTDDPWVAAVCDTLELKVTSQRVQLRDIADGAGVTYREFRELNPAFRKGWVPRGTHRFVLPHDAVDALLESLDGVKLAGRQNGEAAVQTAASEDEVIEGGTATPESGLAPKN